MSVLPVGVRDRAFRMVLGGFEPAAVRTALDKAATELERLRAEIVQLQQQHAEAIAEIDRIATLERSLVRACVAAEEDAQVRSAAARRYATRIIAAAQQAAATRLEAPSRERARLVQDVEAMRAARGRADDALEQLIADLQQAAEARATQADADPNAACAQGVTGAAAGPSASEPFEQPPLGATPALVDGAAHPAATPSSAGAPLELTPEPDTPTAGASSQARRVPSPRGVRMPVGAGAAAAILLLLQGSGGAPPSSRDASEITVAGMAPAPADASLAGLAGLGERPPDTFAAPESATPAGSPRAAGLTMHIKPMRRCWVRVVVDDRTDARELEPGEDIRLEAQRTIVLRAGDAGALSVELNGRVLPPLGNAGQVVERRFTAGTN